MGFSSVEQSFLQDFETRQAADYARFQQRTKKKPIIETLSNPKSFVRAVLLLPVPWVSLFIVCKLTQEHEEELAPAKFLLAFLCGYFLVDLVTGLVHMRFDTIPLKMTADRTAMEFIAWGFQRHHAVQHNWLQDDLLESGILTNGLFAFPFYILYLVLYQSALLTCPYKAFAMTTFLIAGMHTQLIHAAAHNTWKGSNPKLQSVFRLLMDLGLILDTKAHHLHHTQFDCNFSLINGWSNCLLNPLYRYLEKNGYIDPAMQGHAQRKVYIQDKAQLVEPYYHMFPEYRDYRNRIQENVQG